MPSELAFIRCSPMSSFHRSDTTERAAQQIQEPPAGARVSKRVGRRQSTDVIKKMTAKRPEDRFQTYGGLAAALAALAPNVRVKPAAHAVTSTVPTPFREFQRVKRKGRANSAKSGQANRAPAASTRLEPTEDHAETKAQAPPQPLPPPAAPHVRNPTCLCSPLPPWQLRH